MTKEEQFFSDPSLQRTAKLVISRLEATCMRLNIIHDFFEASSGNMRLGNVTASASKRSPEEWQASAYVLQSSASMIFPVLEKSS